MDLSSNLVQPLASVGSAGVTALTRTFYIQRQAMPNWCWVACSVAICQYYGRPGPYTQPNFAAMILNIPACSTGVPYPACNQQHDFGDALARIGHLRLPPVNSPIPPADLAAALAIGPVGCQMQIPRIGGHAVVVVDGGADVTGQLYIRVADPMDGVLVGMPFSQFRNNFRGSGGYWARTYMTH